MLQRFHVVSLAWWSCRRLATRRPLLIPTSRPCVQPTPIHSSRSHTLNDCVLCLFELVGLKFIQELIFRQTPLVRVLRLLCLYCASTGVGVEAERYNDLKRAFMHSYGFEHTLTFDHLATMGLFHSKSASKPTPQQAAKLYPSMRKDLSLVKPEDKEDDDPKYSFYYGFAPASAYSLSHSIPITPDGEEQPSILLYFIGGITAAEMSCLRLIGIQRRVRFVFATTSMINGKDLVQFALPDYTI